MSGSPIAVGSRHLGSRVAQQFRGRVARQFAVSALLVASLLGVSGCQFHTLRNYTPANGTQTQLGGVTLRDVTIILTGPDRGSLIGSLTAYEEDELVGVQGIAQNLNGTDGEPLTIPAPTAKVTINRTAPTQLAKANISVQSAALRPGGLAKLRFAFARAGQVELLVTVYSASDPNYSSVPTAAVATPSANQATPTSQPTTSASPTSSTPTSATPTSATTG